MSGSCGWYTFNFLRNCQNIFQIFSIPIIILWELLFCHILANIGHGQSFNFNHCNGSVVSCYCGFNLHFSNDIKHLFSAQVDLQQRTDWKVETTFQIPFHLGSLMRTVFCQLNHQVVPSWISVGFPKFLSNESQSQTVEWHERERTRVFSLSLCFRLYLWQQVNFHSYYSKTECPLWFLFLG